MSNDTDDYILKPIEEYHTNYTTRFGIKISFERNPSGITEKLMNYHLMCSMLVMISSINFLVDPKCVPGRAGLLVTLFLVLTSFFSAAQVPNYYIGIFLSSWWLLRVFNSDEDFPLFMLRSSQMTSQRRVNLRRLKHEKWKGRIKS